MTTAIRASTGDADENGNNGQKSSSNGCSGCQSGGAGSGAAWLGFFLLLGLARRRVRARA